MLTIPGPAYIAKTRKETLSTHTLRGNTNCFTILVRFLQLCLSIHNWKPYIQITCETENAARISCCCWWFLLFVLPVEINYDLFHAKLSCVNFFSFYTNLNQDLWLISQFSRWILISIRFTTLKSWLNICRAALHYFVRFITKWDFTWIFSSSDGFVAKYFMEHLKV